MRTGGSRKRTGSRNEKPETGVKSRVYSRDGSASVWLWVSGKFMAWYTFRNRSSECQCTVPLQPPEELPVFWPVQCR